MTRKKFSVQYFGCGRTDFEIVNYVSASTILYVPLQGCHVNLPQRVQEKGSIIFQTQPCGRLSIFCSLSLPNPKCDAASGFDHCICHMQLKNTGNLYFKKRVNKATFFSNFSLTKLTLLSFSQEKLICPSEVKAKLEKLAWRSL